ncbi:MAG: hypothetical protein ACK501_12175 [Planctomycetota bacterium]
MSLPWFRISAAIGLAALGVVVLHSFVEGADRREKAAQEPSAPAPSPSPLAELGVPLRSVPGAVHVASRLEAVAPDIAPVLQVLADGSVALRRALPAPTSPLAGAAGPRGAAAVLLPAAALRRLDGPQRGALLAVVGAWIDERPVPPQRLLFPDVQVEPGELAELLSWAP